MLGVPLFFSRSPFSFTGGESLTPPTSPISLPARRKPFRRHHRPPGAVPLHAPPPHPFSRTLRPGYLLPPPNPLVPVAASAASTCLRRRASRSALAAAGGAACCGSRGRLLRCALSRRVFSLSTPSRKDRSRSACLGFGPLSILANLGSQSMTEMASWILIHGDVEHLGDFYFHQGNFTIHIGTGR
jgi:hypothetical protein